MQDFCNICCPEHPDTELREEYSTGFCIKCCKNYDLCTQVMYMERCNLLKGHKDRHVTKRGVHWEFDAKGFIKT